MVQWKDLFETEKDLQLFHPNSEMWGPGRPREVSKLPLNKNQGKDFSTGWCCSWYLQWNPACPLNILIWVPLCAAGFLKNT